MIPYSASLRFLTSRRCNFEPLQFPKRPLTVPHQMATNVLGLDERNCG